MSSLPDYNKIWTNVYGDLQEIGPAHRHMKRITRRLLSSIEYDSILDVGCGMGHNLPLLCEGRNPQRIAGIDISSKAIEHMRNTVGDSFHQIDIQKEKLNGLWDLVFCSLLLEHVPDDKSTLRNIRAMTGKYLFLSTIAGPFERYRTWEEKMGHVRNYQVGELESKLTEAGFTIEKVIYWGFPFFSPLVRLLQNHMTPENRMGITERLTAAVIYYLYFLNSYQKGDLLFILARIKK